MRTVFRVDAAPDTRSVQLARCLTLARQLVRRGASITFVVREHDPNWYGRVAAAGISIMLLPKPEGVSTTSRDNYGSRVGVPQAVDAEQTLNAIGPEGCDLLVVDHCGLDADWERRVRAAAKRVMAIDDRLDRRHDVDVLLNQNPSALARVGGGSDLADKPDLLLGPRYAILVTDTREVRELRVHSSGAARRVVVDFGGADPSGLTLRTLETLFERRYEHLEIDLVLGTATSERAKLERLALSRGRTRLHSDLPSLAGLLVDCDLAIGGAGPESWERAGLGVPSIIIALAASQLDNAQSLDRAGAVSYLGPADELTSQALEDAIDGLVSDPSTRRTMGSRGLELVDGLGVLRVAEALLPSDAETVRVRRASVSPHDELPEVAEDLDAESSIELFLHDLPIGAASIVDQADAFQVRLDLDEVVAGRGWGDDLIWKVVAAHRLGRGPIGSTVAKRVPVGLARDRVLPGNPMRIGVVSDSRSWINASLPKLLWNWLMAGHLVDWRHNASEVADSDVSFYLSYERIVRREILARHGHNLVVHPSDLPRGRGWSPMSWSILAGESTVMVSLLEAADEVDAGDIYAQRHIELEGHELVEEWRRQQSDVILELCRWAVEHLDNLGQHAREQQGDPTWLPRRRPEDSELDPHQTIAAQFDLLRVVDNDRFPAFFEYRGHRYRLTVEPDQPSEA